MCDFEDDIIKKNKRIEQSNLLFKYTQIERNIEKFTIQINNYIEKQRKIRQNIIVVNIHFYSL